MFNLWVRDVTSRLYKDNVSLLAEPERQFGSQGIYVYFMEVDVMAPI